MRYSGFPSEAAKEVSAVASSATLSSSFAASQAEDFTPVGGTLRPKAVAIA